MFFVRVNRFWCVWTRVLVLLGVKHPVGPARVFGNGLSDLEAGVESRLYNCEKFECSDV